MAGEGYSTAGGYELRPILASDVPALAALALEVWGPGEDRTPELVGRRARHLVAGCDPSSCVAETPTGQIIALALTRRLGPVVLLAWAMTHPAWQGQGVGRALLAGFPRAEDGVQRLIPSSPDPRAMRRYHALGLALRPAVSAGGILRSRAVAPAPEAREVAPLEAAALLDRLGGHVRGASYELDAELMQAQGDRAHVCGEDAVVIRGGGVIRLAAARTPEAARQALRSALAGVPPGATVHLNQLREGMDWAIDEAFAAGLAFSPEGPVFSDQPLHPLHLPNGSLG